MSVGKYKSELCSDGQHLSVELLGNEGNGRVLQKSSLNSEWGGTAVGEREDEQVLLGRVLRPPVDVQVLPQPPGVFG